MTPEEIAALPYRPCVGIVLANREGRIFAGQRSDRDVDAWQMPQGGIDLGETPKDAAVRELTEETGLPASAVRIEAETAGWLRYDLPHDVVPKIWKGRYRGQEQKWFLLRLAVDDTGIDIATAHPEFSEWRWMTANELLANIVPFKRPVYEAVLSEFGDRL